MPILGAKVKQSATEHLNRRKATAQQAGQGHLWQNAQAPWSIAQPKPLLPPQIAPPQPGNAWFDLGGYGTVLLRAAGVRREQIEVSEVCTDCSSPGFASYRRRTHQPEEPKTLIYSGIARHTPLASPTDLQPLTPRMPLQRQLDQPAHQLAVAHPRRLPQLGVHADTGKAGQ